MTSTRSSTGPRPSTAPAWRSRTTRAYQRGKINSVYQELRLAGKFRGKGNWIIGANYEYDHSWDSFLQTYNGSSADPTQFLNQNFLRRRFLHRRSDDGVLHRRLSALRPVVLPQRPGGLQPGREQHQPERPHAELPGGHGHSALCGAERRLLPILYGNNAIVLGPTRPEDNQITNTYAVYGSFEYPILDTLTLLGGVRFTEEDKLGGVCGNDGGDGTWAQVAYTLQ